MGSEMCIRDSYRPLRHTQPWQPRSLSKIPTHAGRPSHTHAHTYNARQRDKKADSPATHSCMGGEINVVLQQQRMVNWDLRLASYNKCASSYSRRPRSVMPRSRRRRRCSEQRDGRQPVVYRSCWCVCVNFCLLWGHGGATTCLRFSRVMGRSARGDANKDRR